MPLDINIIIEIMSYCQRDLPQSFDWYLNEFGFIQNDDLKKELAKEFYSARYVYKLMEALNVSNYELHAHSKFQVIQYASIYEAVINYLLRGRGQRQELLIKVSLYLIVLKMSDGIFMDAQNFYLMI